MASSKFAVLAAAWVLALPTTSLAQSAIVTTDASISSAPGAELVGLWGFDNCSEDENYEFQGLTLTAFSVDDGIRVQPQDIRKVSGSDWYVLRIDETDNAPFLARRDGDKLLQAWPKTNPETDQEILDRHRDLISGTLSPEKQPNDFNILTGEMCRSLSLPAALAVGESFAFLKSIDKAIFTCWQNAGQCAQALFSSFDVTGDGELSVAEMSRGFRASFMIGAATDESSDAEDIAISGAAAAGLGPLAAAALLHSMDYDRSGAISFNEMLAERLPAEFTGAEDIDISAADVFQAISSSAKQAVGRGAMFLR